MNLEINKKNTIHFIGIGGIGMSGIALIMKNLGYNIQGSDLVKSSRVINYLKKNRIKIFHNHNSREILKADIVVTSTAIKKFNKEFQLAKKNNLIIVKRADMLAHLLNLKKNIIISGSHGKTTITSLIAHLLTVNKFSPTIVNGGIINSLQSNAALGKSEWSVVEADESDGSFLKFKSIYSIVSNIDHEHMDYYKNFSNLKKQFTEFLQKTPLLGKNIVCLDDKNISSILKKINKKNFLTYGFSKKSNLQCKNINQIDFGMRFDVLVKLKNKEKLIKNIKINLMGRHNVLNATAALAVGLLLKIKIDDIKKSFENFSGVQRRLTLIFNRNNNLIYDDYAHHPTEIKAVLSACRNNFGDKKIISIFQPHRFSRVNSLYKDFTKSFIHSDQVVICPIYSAGEKNNNFNFKNFCENISKNSKTELIKVNDKDELENFLKKNLTKNQIVVAMGAGSISAWIREISNKLMNVKH